MRNIAIIPARAGSKTIINKNLTRVGNKRIIDITVQSAIESDIFSQIILTTDIDYLIDFYKKDRNITTHKRPKEHCEDGSLMREVILDTIQHFELRSDSLIWLLQPTTPFRTKEDFKEIEHIMWSKAPKSLISMKEVGASHPNRMYTIKHGILWSLKNTNFENKQELMPIYIRNGAFYVFKCDAFLKDQSYFIRPCLPYVMPEDRSVNIDSQLDLVLANTLEKFGFKDE